MSGETPDLPCVPELPGRGPGADMIGRGLAVLAQVAPEFAGETTPGGWRLAGRTTDAGSRTMRRAQAWLAQDLDVAQEGYVGAPAVKWALAGPWTLAANVDLPGGHRILSDPGALRDVVAAFETAVDLQVAMLSSRFGDTRAVLQLDEPSLPAVLAGGIPTVSGLDSYRSVPADRARDALRRIVAAAQGRGALVVVHCCAVPAPIELLRDTGADALSVDLTGQAVHGGRGQDEELLGALLESETGLVAGVLPWQRFVGYAADEGATKADPAVREAEVTATVGAVMALTDRLGIPLDDVLPAIAISTSCGLAGLSPAGAGAAVRALAAISATLRKEVA